MWRSPPGATPHTNTPYSLIPTNGWRRPTLPHPPRCSTIGADRLSFRVRKGTGRDPAAKTTDKTLQNKPHTQPPHTNTLCFLGVVCRVVPDTAQQTRKYPFYVVTQQSSCTPTTNIVSYSFNRLGQLVPVTSTPYSASRSGLSTP